MLDSIDLCPIFIALALNATFPIILLTLTLSWRQVDIDLLKCS